MLSSFRLYSVYPKTETQLLTCSKCTRSRNARSLRQNDVKKMSVMQFVYVTSISWEHLLPCLLKGNSMLHCTVLCFAQLIIMSCAPEMYHVNGEYCQYFIKKIYFLKIFLPYLSQYLSKSS